jgi:hypothetical protein
MKYEMLCDLGSFFICIATSVLPTLSGYVQGMHQVFFWTSVPRLLSLCAVLQAEAFFVAA